MNIIAQYRQAFNLTQRGMVEELSMVFPEMQIDTSLLSKMENDICRPSTLLQEYLEKALASCPKRRNTEDRVNIPNELKKLLNEPIYQNIYNELLRATKNSPLTKSSIMAKFNIRDRTIRKIIQEFRLAGLRVCSSSSALGYWISEGPEDYQSLRNEYLSRARNIWKVVGAMDRSIEGQVEMEI